MSKEYPYHIRDVHISDPFILADPATGLYYTYVQFIDKKRFPDQFSKDPCFYVIKSPDLINWSVPEICFRKEDFWADLDYWAPEVHIWDGKYYLISSFRAKGSYRRCQCLASDAPDGPFVPHGEPLTPEGWHCLDGTLYQDRAGKPWLVFCHEWLQVGDGQVCAVPLKTDLSGADGAPMILFRGSEAPWRRKIIKDGAQGYVTDGPFLYRTKNGTLLMLWSNFEDNGGYCIGCARSESGEVYGPWVQDPDPLYALDGGHAMLFHTFDGQLMMACHCPNEHMRKRILLFQMEEKADSLHIINEVTGNWYHAVGGLAKRYAYKDKCGEQPVFTPVAQYPDKK